MDMQFAATFLGALFAIMNPFSNLPVFLSLTEGASPADQRRAALRVAFYVAAMGALVALAGDAVLHLFGVGVDDFRLAGGLIVLLLALGMLNGQDSGAHHGSPRERQSFAELDSIAFYPMAFPMLMGPGTIATLILFAHKAEGAAQKLAFWAVFAALVALLAAVFVFAGALGRHLSARMRVIMTRVMGMILAAIAVGMLTDGLKALLPGLAG